LKKGAASSKETGSRREQKSFKGVGLKKSRTGRKSPFRVAVYETSRKEKEPEKGARG